MRKLELDGYGWWIPRYPVTGGRANTEEHLKAINPEAHFPVFVCKNKECNKPFEEQPEQSSEQFYTSAYYRKGFPTYGLKRKLCKICREENNARLRNLKKAFKREETRGKLPPRERTVVCCQRLLLGSVSDNIHRRYLKQGYRI